ncbi:MBL fold metallo-hydrolase [Paraferrimonas sp. SM1919]|uniref:MBL fold metallo-hydrolase n=1 Tax=Paraferrimonas sp. SM1919 TaxID=2662263 RepID=UPI0013D76E56|nr:MBL fold metallo-hydrolase [Paraferrimonas sp. SM1919]
MQRKIIPVTPFAQNCSVIWCEQTLAAAVIDPGGDIQKIIAVINQYQLQVDKILLTHGHLDHVGGAQELADALAVPVLGPHKADEFWLSMLDQQALRFGLTNTGNLTPSRYLEEGEVIDIGNMQLEVIFTPGHTPGHIVFVNKQQKHAWVGDVLFKGSIGRTDFPMSVHQDLIDSIKLKLLPLGEEYTFTPGHGPESSFGFEAKTNPFLS